MSEMKFAGQVALVTGASRGIGAAIASELTARGLTVIGTATSDEGAARIGATLGVVPGSASGCRGAKLDVNDAAAAEALIDEIVKAHGGLQVLVNNAGITRDMLAMRLKDDDWDAVLDTNLKAVFRMSRAVIRPMMKQRYGRIVSITSVVGASGNAGQANYAAAKAGVAGMTRALARELGSRFHRDRHDRRLARRAAEGAARPDPAGPPGQAGRHRARGGLSGEPSGRVCHGSGAARQRWHVHVLSRRTAFIFLRRASRPAGHLGRLPWRG